jgi:oligopeptide/dipeptide ABC transporter ATP-binding protein
MPSESVSLCTRSAVAPYRRGISRSEVKDRVAQVMLEELAASAALFTQPRHPYTKALLSAIPRLGQKGFAHMRIEGEVPTPIDLPPGCVFHTRCPYAVDPLYSSV